METVRRINNELAIADPLTHQQFQELAEEGFRSVLNLRSLDELTLTNERLHVESLGLRYVNLAIDSERMNLEAALKVLRQMDELPKPTLVYCKNATLAAAMVLMYIAIHQGETLSQAFKRAEKFELFRSSSKIA